MGSGKSTVAQELAARGAVVIDSDQVARAVMAPGTGLEKAVRQHFGPPVATADGGLDRAALAHIVFADPTELAALEALAHPPIRREVARRLAAAEAAGADVAVVELPLLDSARRRQYQFDLVVLVDIPRELAVKRVVARGMDEADARARLAAQPGDEQRRAAADMVISNTGDREQLASAVDDLWRALAEQASSATERTGGWRTAGTRPPG